MSSVEPYSPKSFQRDTVPLKMTFHSVIVAFKPKSLHFSPPWNGLNSTFICQIMRAWKNTLGWFLKSWLSKLIFNALDVEYEPTEQLSTFVGNPGALFDPPFSTSPSTGSSVWCSSPVSTQTGCPLVSYLRVDTVCLLFVSKPSYHCEIGYWIVFCCKSL